MNLSVGAVFVRNSSHKGIHMELAFFDNQPVIAIG